MARLIEELTRLPGIGPKTAQRLSFFLISQSQPAVQSLADAIVEAKKNARNIVRSALILRKRTPAQSVPIQNATIILSA